MTESFFEEVLWFYHGWNWCW